ncbi:hypothetical protein Tco_0763573, partial [Tanacetum coccineum]
MEIGTDSRFNVDRKIRDVTLEQLSYLTTSVRKETLRIPYLIFNICGGAHEADECDSNKPREQECLSGGDMDVSLYI